MEAALSLLAPAVAGVLAKGFDNNTRSAETGPATPSTLVQATSTPVDALGSAGTLSTDSVRTFSFKLDPVRLNIPGWLDLNGPSGLQQLEAVAAQFAEATIVGVSFKFRRNINAAFPAGNCQTITAAMVPDNYPLPANPSDLTMFPCYYHHAITPNFQNIPDYEPEQCPGINLIVKPGVFFGRPARVYAVTNGTADLIHCSMTVKLSIKGTNTVGTNQFTALDLAIPWNNSIETNDAGVAVIPGDVSTGSFPLKSKTNPDPLGLQTQLNQIRAELSKFKRLMQEINDNRTKTVDELAATLSV